MIALLAVFALTACNNKAIAQTVPLTMYQSSDGTQAAVAAGSYNVMDTITNAGTIYLHTKTAALNKFNTNAYRCVFTVENLSGTSTFTVIQQGSMDGLTWFNLTNGRGVDGYNSDSLSVSGATDGLQYTLTSIPGASRLIYGINIGGSGARVLFYRLKIVGSGTQSTQVHTCRLYPLGN